MAHLVFGRDEVLIEWAARQMPLIRDGKAFGPAKAVGVSAGPDPSDRLWAVCVFHGYDPGFKVCQISMAAANPRWASKDTIRQLLAIPFVQYGCWKVFTTTPHTSERTIDFNRAIGFTKEAVLSDQFGPGVHAVICRMRLSDYRFRYLNEPEFKAYSDETPSQRKRRRQAMKRPAPKKEQRIGEEFALSAARA